MEKTRVKEKEPAGLAMLQTTATTRRQQAVGQQSPPQKDNLRKWQPSKVQSPKKGLGEIEEIDKEESSMKTMHALERYIRGHPTIWKESAAQYLITEIADVQHAGPRENYKRNEAKERVQRIITELLVPMVQILESQEEEKHLAAKQARESERLLRQVQEERDRALWQLEQESEKVAHLTVSNISCYMDLEEVSSTLEETRVAARQEAAETQDLVQDKLQIVTTQQTPQKIQRKNRACQGLTSYSTGGLRMPENTPILLRRMVYVLLLIGTEVLTQMVHSWSGVKGLWSLIPAFIGFWFGLAWRMMYLALMAVSPNHVQQTTLKDDVPEQDILSEASFEFSSTSSIMTGCFSVHEN